jgi:glucose/arabinose dehydrogenase
VRIVKFHLKNLKIIFLVNIFCLIATSIPPSIANEISPNKTRLETQFYNLDVNLIPTGQSDGLLLARSGKTIFVGHRIEKFITYGELTSQGSFTNRGTIKLPEKFSGKLTGDLILDLHSNRTDLFVAVGMQTNSTSETCGGVYILKYLKKNKYSYGQQIFQSSPCLNGEIGQFPWTARLASDRNYLYVAGGNTLVDFQFGTYPSPVIPSLKNWITIPKTNFYGKVNRINLKTFQTAEFASGIRNLGGLYYDYKNSELYQTDNGPRGGDLLQKIEKGKTYPWPESTLGRPYGSDTTNKDQVKVNSLPEKTLPMFSWTPSISPSMLTRVTGNSNFPFWNDNFLVGSLKGKSIRRLFLKDDIVIYDEEIKIGSRIRSLIVTDEMNILLGSDDGKLILLSKSEIDPNGPYPAIS